MPKYKVFSPQHLGCLDAVEAMTPTPSRYYLSLLQTIRYLDGYLYCCTVTTQPRNWRLAADLLRRYSPEQAEAEETAARVMDAMWEIRNQELYADALACDDAQSERTEWQS